MKGMELYSWRAQPEGTWRFALVVGTNRLKGEAEIIAEQFQITSVEALKRQLAALPRGTYVFWHGFPRGVREATVAFRLPWEALLKGIIEHAQGAGLKLHVFPAHRTTEQPRGENRVKPSPDLSPDAPTDPK